MVDSLGFKNGKVIQTKNFVKTENSEFFGLFFKVIVVNNPSPYLHPGYL